MKRVYLFVFADAVGRSDKIKEIIKTVPGVLSWRYEMVHAMYIVTEMGADALAKAIRAKIPKGRFMVTEVQSEDTEKTQGYLTPETWVFIREKQAPSKS